MTRFSTNLACGGLGLFAVGATFSTGDLWFAAAALADGLAALADGIAAYRSRR